MAKQDLGKIVPTFNGIYNANIVYEKLCIVNYKGSVYVSKQDIPKGTDISNEEYWYLLIEKLKKGIDYFTEEDRRAIIDEVTKLAESDFNEYYDGKKKALDKVASDNTAAFLKTVKDNTTDFNSNVDTQTKAFDTHYDEKVKSFDENSDEQTTAYNTNANNKLNDYNENHASKMQELDDEATAKIAEYDEHTEELRALAVSTDNELERVKNEVLDTGSASDNFIHVEDGCMAKIKELGIDGVCKQETTRGYNILDENSWKNGYHVAGNSINTSNNGCHVDFQKIGSTTQYFIRIEALKNCRMGRFFSAFTNESQDTSIDKVSEGIYDTVFSAGQVKYITVNVPDGAFYVGFSIYLIQKIVNGEYVNAIPVYENYKDYFKICISTTYQENYEPFTNGASPNPDYPQEIKTITDSLKVTSCGRNLFDMNKTPYPITANGLTITTKNGYFIVNGTCTSTYANITSAMNFIIPSGTYTISIDAPQNFNITLKRTFLDGSLADIILPANSLAKTFTTGKISNRYYFFLGSLTPGMTIDNAKFKIQFERKDNATSIEDYIESQIQAKLPEGEFIGKIDDTYKDTLKTKYFPEEGQYHWILDKMVGKIILDGTQDILRRETANSSKFRWRFAIPNINNNVNCLCDYLISGNLDAGYRTVNSITTIINNIEYYGNCVFYREDFADKTISEAKQLLAQNNMIIYYALQTPYTIDLGPIDMPLSYKGITNIFTDSDLLPKITTKYYRTFEKTIQNMQINEKSLKQEITDLNNNISDIAKRLEALESANASIVEESEVSNDLQN